jgi:hypothetical protein
MIRLLENNGFKAYTSNVVKLENGNYLCQQADWYELETKTRFIREHSVQHSRFDNGYINCFAFELTEEQYKLITDVYGPFKVDKSLSRKKESIIPKEEEEDLLKEINIKLDKLIEIHTRGGLPLVQ